MKLPVFKPRERRHLLLSPVVCFYKGQISPNAPGGGGGGGLTTFDRLLSPNQGRFALIKVKSPTSPQGGEGVSRNNDRCINSAVMVLNCLELVQSLFCPSLFWFHKVDTYLDLVSNAELDMLLSWVYLHALSKYAVLNAP